MNNQYFDSMNDAGRQAVDFGRQLAEINLRTFDRLADNQVKLWNETVEKGFAQAKRLSEAKGYRDVYEAQMDLAREVTQTAVAQGRETMELLTGTRDELVKAYEAGFEKAAAGVQKAAPKKAG